jgi:transcriptional regulator with XRE-family HTH domain
MDIAHLARAVRDARHALRLSQPDLAKRAGVSAAYVSRVENGRHVRPGKAALDRLAVALGSPSIDALLAGTPPDDADPDAELWRHAQLAYEVLKDLPTRARRVEAMLAMQALAEHFAGQARRRADPHPPITDPDPIHGGAA